jgi:cell division septum initiation protein DivIVA
MVKKILLVMAILLLSAGVFAQDDNPVMMEELKKELQSVRDELQTLQSETLKQKSEISALQTQLATAGETVDSLKQLTQNNSQAIRETADQLGVKISTTEAAANQRFQEVGRSVSNTTLYVVIVFLLAVPLSILLFWLVRRRQKTDKSAIIEQTKAEIEKNMDAIKEYSIMVDNLNRDIAEIIEKIGDHSLALKLASEINRIERNVSLMKEDTKGLKQLKHSIDSLKANLAANGYEIPQLLGKEYHEGMKATVINSTFDENLENGDEVISRVIIPQVNYNRKMIQAAQIEITVGPAVDDNNNNNNNNNNNTKTVQS